MPCPYGLLRGQIYSKAKIRFQSFRMLMTRQPRCLASS